MSALLIIASPPGVQRRYGGAAQSRALPNTLHCPHLSSDASSCRSFQQQEASFRQSSYRPKCFWVIPRDAKRIENRRALNASASTLLRANDETEAWRSKNSQPRGDRGA
jgi:hypothetical protein